MLWNLTRKHFPLQKVLNSVTLTQTVDGINGMRLSTSKISSIAGVAFCERNFHTHFLTRIIYCRHLKLLHCCDQLTTLVANFGTDNDTWVSDVPVGLRVEGSGRPAAEELSHLDLEANLPCARELCIVPL